jgi:DNA-binding transcriptional LysR family regulator
MVSTDVVDLGVIEGHVDRPELLIVPFAQDRLICIAAAGNALQRRTLSPEDVQDQTLLVREDGSGTRQAVLGALDSHGFVFRRIALFGSNEAIKEGVINNLGIAWVPEISVQGELETGALCELKFKNAEIVRPFSLIRRRDEQPTPLGVEFIGIVQALYG